jgi:hypothetical protein
MQLVHHDALSALVPQERRHAAPAILLSGNGPLVEVLQYAIGAKDFVQPLAGYLREHAGPAAPVPPEHIVVFDEAQRAWDAKRVHTKHKGALGLASEPELLTTVVDRVPGWGMVVALVGEGQEIHVGEESGLSAWREALAARPGWRIVAPPRFAANLGLPGVRVEEAAELDLDTSLRSHAAGRIHEWVRRFLEGDLSGAREVALTLEGWDMYVSRDLDAVRRYVRARYSDVGDRRFGLVVSSCAENCRGFAPRIKEDGLNTGYGRWYEGGRTTRHRAGPNFCCSLRTAVSEFGCQGLELDFVVVCWGDDLSWVDGAWRQVGGKRRSGAKDRHRLRLNAYRVLLTRGRDGMCVFVPPEPADSMDAVFQAWRSAGVPELPDS